MPLVHVTADEGGAAAAERNIRGFTFKLDTEEGYWGIVGNKLRPTVDGSHAKLNVKEDQMTRAAAHLRLMRRSPNACDLIAASPFPDTARRSGTS